MPSRAAFIPILACLAGFALTQPAAAQTAAPPKVQLKIGTIAPDGSSWMKAMRDIDATIRKETNNEVGFKLYPGGVQGDEPVVLRKIRNGQLQGGGLTGRGLGSIASGVRVMEVPFLFRDYEQVDRVRTALNPRFESIVKDGGFTVLGWVDVGFVYLFSRKPIAAQADLKSAKMWLWEGDPVAEAFLKSVGVVPVPLAITDVMTSLQTKLVDAVYSSPLGCVALQWFTRVTNYTDLPVTFATGAVVVSNAAFETIPPAHRETVLRICRTKFAELAQRARQEDREALAQIEKSGVAKVTVSPAEAAKFETLGRGVWKDLAGKIYPQELLDAVVAARDATPAGASR
jgi:TRAP-type C4-dicarboxylate transport system substrate-binding protein